MTDEFAPPAVPAADNSTGLPQPPSGTHPAEPETGGNHERRNGWAAAAADRRRFEYSRHADEAG